MAVEDPSLSVWLLFAAVLGFSSSWLWRRACSDVHDISAVPMPTGASWLWGHEKAVLDASAGEAHMHWFNSLGTSVMRIRGAFRMPDILVLGDPSAVAHILQHNTYDYHHSSVTRPRLARLLGKSLVWVEDESEHKRMRALFAPALSASSIREATPEFFALAARICDDLQRVCTDGGSGSATVNILDWLGRATLRMIGRFGFMQDYSQGTDGQAILDTWRKMATAGMGFYGTMALLLLRRFYVLNYLPIKALKEQGDVRLTIHKHIEEKMVQQPGVGHDAGDGGDMLSRLMRLHSQGEISAEELKDHVTIFIMAGFETSAQTLAYAIWELARNQDMQDRLRCEISQFGGRELIHEELQSKLPYMDAVLRETVRLHPVLPYMERQATKDDVLPLRHPFLASDGHKVREVAIRKGQTIVLPVHYLNRSDTAWGDGSVFRPDRWFEEPPSQDLLPKGWSNTLTFSDGPRMCVGYRLAIVQMKVLLYSLISRFKFRDTGLELEHRVTSSIQPCPVGEAHKGPNMPIEAALLSDE